MIYHSPIEMVAALLDAGADPNLPADDGFPPLIAALTCAIQLRVLPPVLMFTNSSSCCSTTARTWVSGVSMTTHRCISRPPKVTSRWWRCCSPMEPTPNEITRIDDYEFTARGGGRRRASNVVTCCVHEHPVSTGNRRRGMATSPYFAACFVPRRIDGHGLTALMRASHEGRADAVTLLIAQGAALDHTSKFGLSAVDAGRDLRPLAHCPRLGDCRGRHDDSRNRRTGFPGQDRG